MAKLDPNNPKTAAVIILTTYSTWDYRSLENQNRALRSERDQERILKLSRLIRRKVRLKTGDNLDHDTQKPEIEDKNNKDNDDLIIDDNIIKLFRPKYKNRFTRVVYDEDHQVKNKVTISHFSVKALLAPYV